MRSSTVHTASLAGAACLVGLVVLQLAGTGTPRSAVLVGQDSDWDVKGWTPEHKINVEASRVDATSVHNIWHSKKQAWAGIDTTQDSSYEQPARGVMYIRSVYMYFLPALCLAQAAVIWRFPIRGTRLEALERKQEKNFHKVTRQ